MHLLKSSYPRPPQSSRRKSTCPAPPIANAGSTTVWGTLGKEEKEEIKTEETEETEEKEVEISTC